MSQHDPKTCRHDHDEDGKCVGYESSSEMADHFEREIIREMIKPSEEKQGGSGSGGFGGCKTLCVAVHPVAEKPKKRISFIACGEDGAIIDSFTTSEEKQGEEKCECRNLQNGSIITQDRDGKCVVCGSSFPIYVTPQPQATQEKPTWEEGFRNKWEGANASHKYLAISSEAMEEMIADIRTLLQSQRTADLEAIREAWPKSPELYPCRPDDIPKERYECYAEQCDRCSFAGGQRKALSDTLSLIEQIMNKKI